MMIGSLELAFVAVFLDALHNAAVAVIQRLWGLVSARVVAVLERVEDLLDHVEAEPHAPISDTGHGVSRERFYT